MNRYILLIAAFLAASALHAQDDPNQRFNPETYGVTSLSIAPDARAGSMGDMGVATEADINSQHWNLPHRWGRCSGSTAWFSDIPGGWCHR